MGIVHSAGFRPQVYRESAWYGPIADALATFDALDRFPTPEELSALYAARTKGLALPPLRFVATPKTKKKKRPKGQVIDPTELYEGRVVVRGEVPTRLDDWHDLFNALAFVHFPRAKLTLHARQYRILTSRLTPSSTRLPNARTREQDALSLFDEGGICIAAPPSLAAELHEADDARLRRELARGTVRVVPFGHALYEHMVAGLVCPLGTACVVPLAAETIASDALLPALDLAFSGIVSDPSVFQLPSPARGNSLLALLDSGP